MGAYATVADLFKVLGDEGRVEVLALLRSKEMAVSEIAVQLKISNSLISQRLKMLYSHGLLKKRRDGQTIYYGLADEHITYILFNAIDHVNHCELHEEQ